MKRTLSLALLNSFTIKTVAGIVAKNINRCLIIFEAKRLSHVLQMSITLCMQYYEIKTNAIMPFFPTKFRVSFHLFLSLESRAIFFYMCSKFLRWTAIFILQLKI